MFRTGPLGLVGRKPARQTIELSSNPSWYATAHPLMTPYWSHSDPAAVSQAK